MESKETKQEEFAVSGDDLVGKLKELIREGSARSIKVRNGKGETVIDVPLSIGIVGVVFLPFWAAVAAMAAVASDYTIVVERDASPESPKTP